MQLRDTPDEAAFRAEVRAWLDEHNPGLDGVPETEDKKAWSRKIYDAGYAGLTWPEEYGGQGASYSHQAIIYEEWARAEAPGHRWERSAWAWPGRRSSRTAPRSRSSATSRTSSRPRRSGARASPSRAPAPTSRRCGRAQSYGTATSSSSGQKVWSSYAHLADWCILVTRSDPESQRHAGLTYMVVDMHSPGVEVRPLRHITGDADFNEIFFENVEVPVENVLDEIGNGWAVAMTTLLHERGTLGFALTGSLEVLVNKVAGLAKERDVQDSRLRDMIAREWIELQALKLTNYRALTKLVETGIPGPEGSVSKLQWSEANATDDEARARDPGRRGRRVVAPRPAPHARQHDRGRHVGDPPQHHRRARARPPEVEMRFAFTEEQDELRRQARALLDEREPTWDELAELGWLGVSVPEEAGGAGLGFVEEAVLFEELGRALYPGPYFATVALALPQLPPDEQALVASGQRKYEDSEVSLDGPVTRTRAFAALAAEAVGIAQKALELAVEHAKSREQFGKPIGIYQAVSHPIVNTFVETELARSLAYWAAWCVAEGDDDATMAALAAKSYAAETAVAACERSIQVHGGIGFTWEHPLHRYYKRAQWIEAFGGYPAKQRAEIAAKLLD